MTSIVSYYNSAIQELNSTNLNDLYDTVLEYAASTTFAGSLAIGTPTGNNTVIGYFTDTVRAGAPGSDGITVLSNTYTVYQYTDTTQSTPSPNVISLQYETYGGLPAVVLQENYNLMSNIANSIITRMVTGYGVGSYHLGNTTPVGDTGVWQNLGKFEDTLNNFTELNNTYFLWKKISTGNSKTLLTPLRLNSSELVGFTTSDINNILYYIEQGFLSTGIGTYVLDTSAPLTGTWSNVGVMSDFIRTINTDNYTNEFTSVTPPTYSGPVTYTGDNSGLFTGPGPITYTGPASFTNPNGQFFTGPGPLVYSGPVAYTGDNASNFTLPGVAYSGPISYTRFIGYTGISIRPDDIYSRSVYFTNPDGVTFSSSPITYSGPAAFTNPDAVFYTGVTPTAYSGPIAYTRDNAGNFTGFVPTNYTGIAPFTNPDAAVYTGVSTFSTLYDTLYERQTVAPSLQQNPSVTLWVRIG